MYKRFFYPPQFVPSSFSLDTVASALCIVSDAVVEAVSDSFLHVRSATDVSTTQFKLSVINRYETACIVQCLVVRDTFTLYNSGNMRVDVTNKDCAVGILVGVFYRRAVMLDPLPPFKKEICVTVACYVNQLWSPVRLARFAAILYTHTYNTKYIKVACDPSSINTLSLRGHAATPTKLTIDYKPNGVALATSVAEHFVPYPGTVSLILTPSTFTWQGLRANSEVAELCKRLWQQLTIMM